MFLLFGVPYGFGGLNLCILKVDFVSRQINCSHISQIFLIVLVSTINICVTIVLNVNCKYGVELISIVLYGIELISMVLYGVELYLWCYMALN